MKKHLALICLMLLAFILCSCANIPQVPTSTPTMNAEQMQQAAMGTAETLRRETETQWAIDNPSPTPTDTATPTPEYTPTSPLPLIPPTATEAPRPMLSVGYSNYTLYKIGDPGDYNYVPLDNLYIEVCFTNEGSISWNENYYVMCTLHRGDNIQPSDGVRLGKTVNTGEKGCFSFQRLGSPNTALGAHTLGFQLYTDGGAAMRNGYISFSFTIH